MDRVLSKKKIAAGRKALGMTTPPNTRLFSDFAFKINNNTVVHRLFVIELKTGKFELKEFKYNLPRASQPILKTTLTERDSYDDAVKAYEDKKSELVDYGFSLVAQEELQLTTAFDSGFYVNRFEGAVFSELAIKKDYIYQTIKGGIHCYLKINQYGEIALHEINHANESINSHCVITPYIKCFADTLITRENFKGAIIEGFATETTFDIIDAGFIDDIDLSSFTLEKRLEVLSAYIGDNFTKYGVSLCRPVNGPKSAIVRDELYVVERLESADFSLFSENNKPKCIFSKNNILELEPIANNKGTVRCQYVSNQHLSYTFNYLCKKAKLGFEYYCVSDMGRNPTLIF